MFHVWAKAVFLQKIVGWTNEKYVSMRGLCYDNWSNKMFSEMWILSLQLSGSSWKVDYYIIFSQKLDLWRAESSMSCVVFIISVSIAWILGNHCNDANNHEKHSKVDWFQIVHAKKSCCNQDRIMIKFGFFYLVSSRRVIVVLTCGCRSLWLCCCYGTNDDDKKWLESGLALPCVKIFKKGDTIM